MEVKIIIIIIRTTKPWKETELVRSVYGFSLLSAFPSLLLPYLSKSRYNRVKKFLNVNSILPKPILLHFQSVSIISITKAKGI